MKKFLKMNPKRETITKRYEPSFRTPLDSALDIVVGSALMLNISCRSESSYIC